MVMPTASCRKLLAQETRLDFSLALAKAGNSSAARIAMMAMTTRSSISVKARRVTAGGWGEQIAIANPFRSNAATVVSPSDWQEGRSPDVLDF